MIYLVDGEHLAVGLLHLLELPQEVPARKQSNNQTHKRRRTQHARKIDVGGGD